MNQTKNAYNTIPEISWQVVKRETAGKWDFWSILSWTSNQKITIINMLVYSLPCTDNEFMHEIRRRLEFTKLRAMKMSPDIR